MRILFFTISLLTCLGSAHAATANGEKTTHNTSNLPAAAATTVQSTPPAAVALNTDAPLNGEHAAITPPSSLTPNQAARAAQKVSGGGRILAVESLTGGYRVKLLLNRGIVKILFVPN